LAFSAGLPADEIGQENVIYALPDAQRRAVNLRLMQFYNQTQAGPSQRGDGAMRRCRSMRN
jgi:hypothetical protein